MTQSPTATIITLKYNQPALEAECHHAIRQHTNLDHHTLVIQDNYSRDMNIGALWNELIWKTRTKYVCLLNSDATVEAGWLDTLIQCAERHKADAVGPMTDGTCGTPAQKFGRFRKGDCVEVDQLSGFCMLIRRDTWKKVGGFREDYPFYGQESNFCRQIGTKIVCREVVVDHKGGYSIKAAGRYEEERRLSQVFWDQELKFDWTKRIAVLGTETGSITPLWAGIDDAVREFNRQSTPILYLKIPTHKNQFAYIEDWNPDVVIVVSQRPLDTHFAQWFSTWKGPAKGLWFNDLRPPDNADRYTGLFDRIFVCFDQDHEEWSTRARCPVQYMPQGSRIWPELRPMDDKPKQVIFIGDVNSNVTWHNGRTEIVHELKADILNSAITPDRIKIEQSTPAIYRQYQFCLSMSPVAQGYQSLRLYNILAYGGLALQKDFPGRNKLFHSGRHLLCFREPRYEALESLENSWKLENIRRRGWRLSQAKHTGMQRILNMTSSLLTDDHSFWGYL